MGQMSSNMIMLQSSDPRTKTLQENSILSFNAAFKVPINFIEFDIQIMREIVTLFFYLL
ncbi:hypothetical protein ACB092_12G018300 [Castanea dentata]